VITLFPCPALRAAGATRARRTLRGYRLAHQPPKGEGSQSGQRPGLVRHHLVGQTGEPSGANVRLPRFPYEGIEGEGLQGKSPPLT